MLSPFHVFILGTCILWYVDDYTVRAANTATDKVKLEGVILQLNE
jgi:hypothetical protein